MHGALSMRYGHSAMELPAESPARQLAENLLSQQELALTELGLEIEDQNLSRTEQLALIEQTTDQVLPDQTLGELARLMVHPKTLNRLHNRGLMIYPKVVQ